jgi:hypothetical protein
MSTDAINSFHEDDAMDLRLWEYIDGVADEKEKSAVEKLIEENMVWRNKYHDLLEVHQLVQATELEQPSMRFTKNVMEQIARTQIAPATKKYLNNRIIWGLGFFFITMLVGFLVYGISQIDWATTSNSGSTLGIDMDKVDFSKMFNNTFVNIFMMLNVVLGLILLERYLSNRNKKLMEQS